MSTKSPHKSPSYGGQATSPSGRANADSLLAALDASSKLLFGAPALHIAAQDGYKKVAEVLILNGSNARERDAEGRTALERTSDPHMRTILQSKPPMPLPNVASKRMVSAQEYIAEHKLLELFESLTAEVLFHQPADLRAFLVQRCEEIQAARRQKREELLLFKENDFSTLFSLYDISKTGTISVEQYVQAMQDIGVLQFDRTPAAAVDGRLSREAFVQLAKDGLQSRCAP